MNRFSLAVFGSDNTLAFSTTKNASVDEDFSDPISCSLLPGDYHFVAVIHQANDTEEVAAAIASTSQATITTSKMRKVFSVNQAGDDNSRPNKHGQHQPRQLHHLEVPTQNH